MRALRFGIQIGRVKYSFVCPPAFYSQFARLYAVNNADYGGVGSKKEFRDDKSHHLFFE